MIGGLILWQVYRLLGLWSDSRSSSGTGGILWPDLGFEVKSGSGCVFLGLFSPRVEWYNFMIFLGSQSQGALANGKTKNQKPFHHIACTLGT